MTYSHVDKEVKVGDKIRITKAMDARGRYKTGDILTVKEVLPASRVMAEEHDRVIHFVEFEVIEEEKHEPKPGDLVEVVNPTYSAGRYNTGDILTVVDVSTGYISGRRMVSVAEHDQPLFVDEVKVVHKAKPSALSVLEANRSGMNALASRLDAIEVTVTAQGHTLSQKADKRKDEEEMDVQAEIDRIENYLVRKYPGADVSVKVDIEFEGVGSRTRF
jgi:hypothetical protein